MSHLLAGILRGYGIVKPRVYYLEIGHPLFFLAFLAICFLLGLPFISIIYAYTFSMAMVFISIGSFGYKKIGLNPFPLRGGQYGKMLLKFSLPLLAAGVMVVVMSWTDTMMLGRYMGMEDVGVYNISISLARLLIFPLGALSFVFMPLAGDMYAKGQHAELKRIYQVLTKWIFSFTLPVFFVLFFFPEMTITFLFGKNFVDSASPLRILSLGVAPYG